MRLFKRGNGVWYVETARGRKHSLKTRDRRLAEKIYRKVKEGLVLGRLLLPEEKLPAKTLGEFRGEFLAAAGAKPRKTWLTYKDSLDRLAAAFGEGYPLTGINVLAAEGFQADLAGRYAPASVNIWTRTLRAAFGKAVEAGYLKTNPFAKVKPLRVPKRTGKILDEGQVEALLDACPSPETRLFTAVALYTGMRRADIHKLQARDVDLADRWIDGGRQAKTGLPCGVPICTPLVEEFLRFGPPEVGTLFIHHIDHYTKAFKFAADAAGLDGLRLHDCRHVFANDRVRAGVDVSRVSRLLGHRSVNTTVAFYLEQDRDDLREAVEKGRGATKTRPGGAKLLTL